MKHMDMTFSGMKALLTLVGSKRLNTDLSMFIPKQRLDIGTTDNFAQKNKIRKTNKDENNNPTQIKTKQAN